MGKWLVASCSSQTDCMVQTARQARQHRQLDLQEGQGVHSFGAARGWYGATLYVSRERAAFMPQAQHQPGLSRYQGHLYDTRDEQSHKLADLPLFHPQEHFLIAELTPVLSSCVEHVMIMLLTISCLRECLCFLMYVPGQFFVVSLTCPAAHTSLCRCHDILPCRAAWLPPCW